MQNAEHEREHHLLNAECWTRQADLARRFGELKVAKIYDDGAAKAKELAEDCRRRLIGAK